ncbi:MAG: hypothetical protein ACD_25C00054G0007 [uncultured bacterium]|uniref:Uncharacterized protein n=1 Tax=candidate division WWE3 bacterium TaxID=2053526 RepID=A0A656PQV1_UNCKA|nr:hypothetical protein P147_WWE3C00001G0268 [candidate division WWE3 bacterium RAAC2_WWE3_1]EKD95144.1 MAG: hypothetical protein ACD_25C00054G0007 [uncultured bacterium]KKS29625.1 MAG: hypothetical protein UU91_C0004G0017 [candidate division WWE3 bacterium GW2011_GWB1_42_117]KKS55435.1 MAG: hypothetical protein UV21_C0001G0017 [candidate division WWE3 bacterium GW2011_GWD2_42_34]KKT05920.1 MAG: hypothetical protein UV83_C0001G0238 [candidate division WWE3 bacterium GW2011_GWE2_43_18]KKT07191.
MANKNSHKQISIYSFSFLVVLGLMLAFSGSLYGSYRLSKAVAEENPTVLSDEDDREDSGDESNDSDDDNEIDDVDENDDSDDKDGSDDIDEADDIDGDELEDSDEPEDEDEPEDGDELDDNDEDESLKDELESFVESQKDLQEESIDQLEKISERGGVTRFLIGPNFESIRKLQEVIDANTRMLAQIQQIRSGTITPEEQQALDTLSSSIENQNQVINNQLSEQEGSFSLFGWLVRLLSRD